MLLSLNHKFWAQDEPPTLMLRKHKSWTTDKMEVKLAQGGST
jgi:hypothetical protein